MIPLREQKRNSNETESKSVVRWLGEHGLIPMPILHSRGTWSNRNVLKHCVIMVMVTQVYTFTKVPWTVHLQGVFNYILISLMKKI
jgi:hypothetical protein